MATFFVRALYDYQSTDASSLSFRSGDLIEVLSQLESGWWDGLLDNERGWFPSNYVAPVSEQEVEEEFVQATSAAVAAANPGDRMAPPNGHPSQNEDDSEWSEEDLLGGGGGIAQLAETVMNSSSSAAATASDFWMPQVTSDGQASQQRPFRSILTNPIFRCTI
jgi:son of sevenless-like protein